ncbi:MAG: carbohydrate ABC transporter permease [Nitrososphaerota archaeon]|nr:carbohydrate ABC transporter permease [Nitrososphaerota archaeon]
MGQNTKKRRPSLGSVMTYVVLVLAALYSFWPILIMALEGYQIDLAPLFSGKAVRSIGGVPFYSGGIYPTPIHYIDAIKIVAFPRLLGNTSLIAAISISVALAAGVTAAYALARLPVRGKGIITYTLLALRAVSPFALIVPLYIFFTRNGLWDTYLGVGLAEEVAILSMVVWMLRGFFTDIPKEVYDAAAVFGASEWQIFRRVALRMVIPGIVVTSLFAFVLIWNEFPISEILTGPVTKTVAVGVWSGLGETTNSFMEVSFDDLNAAGFLAWIPAIIVILAIRRYLAKGYSLGTASSK